VFTFVKISLIS